MSVRTFYVHLDWYGDDSAEIEVEATTLEEAASHVLRDWARTGWTGAWIHDGAETADIGLDDETIIMNTVIPHD